MASFTQAISDGFSAIYHAFASVLQAVLSVLQSLVSLFNTIIKDVTSFAARFVDLIFQNIVIILAIAGAFFLFSVYRQGQGRPVIPEKKSR